MNDAAVRIRLVIFGSKVPGYSSFKHRIQTDWRGEGGEGVPPLCLAVLADGHLVRGPTDSLGGRPPRD